jgi:hypothetical protein
VLSVEHGFEKNDLLGRALFRQDLDATLPPIDRIVVLGVVVRQGNRTALSALMVVVADGAGPSVELATLGLTSEK